MAYAPLGQFQCFAHLFEDKALVELEGCDETFPILEPTHGVDELEAQIHEIRMRLRLDRRNVLDECTIL